MTNREHQLVIEMFKHQTLVFATLIETLKSQGIVQNGDLAAYDQLLSQDENLRNVLEKQVEDQYRDMARILGVNVALA